MSVESGLQFTPEKPKVSETERDLNEIIPILAHGLVRRIEQRGFYGKIRVQALAGDAWGVAKSPDNSTDIPNVIIYPRESLTGDPRLVNARLRHEIGNLNYPIDSEINALRGWCYENNVAPELLTSLVEATHEASVNYLEMQNSHSDTPQENFRALYEREINTQQIADGVAQSAPYKQAVDLTLLYSLSQTGLIPTRQFEHALESAHPAVQDIFDKQTRSVLDQSFKMAVPKKQVQLVRDFLWPKFSKLVTLSDSAQAESKSGEAHDKKAEALIEGLKGEKNSETSARAQQANDIQAKMQKLMEKMKQEPQSKSSKKPSQESKQPQEQQFSPAEQKERKEEEDLLAKNLQEQLKQAKEQLEKLRKPGQQPEVPNPQEKSPSMQDIGKQAEQMKAEAEKAMQEAKEVGTDEITEEQLEKLQEQLEQLEAVAKQIAESGSLAEDLAKPEEEPTTYNIKEYGINEADLTPEQLDHLQKVRSFAQGTSKVYRTTMRLLMTGYQRHNPKFTNKMMQKMIERNYDVPDFSIYGSQAAEEFLSQQPELGVDGFSDNFLVNFQLPKPLAKFWYKGGSGRRSVPVKEGEIEWGHFYRMAMPMIYSGVDKAGKQGLYLNRLNQFGQHDPKKYYYLWETINTALAAQENETPKDIQKKLQEMQKKLDEINEKAAGKTDNKKTEQSEQKSDDTDNQKQEGGEKKDSAEQKSGEQGQSGQERQSSEKMDEEPSSQELQKQMDKLKEQIDQMIQEAEDRGDQSTADELTEMKEQLEQIAKELEKSEQKKGQSDEQGGEDGEESEAQAGQSGEGEGQESESPGEGSGEGKGEGQGEGSGKGKGEGKSGSGSAGQGQGEGEGGQEDAQDGQPGGKSGQGHGQSGGQQPGGEMGGKGGMSSAQEMQEMLSQMQDMLNQSKEQEGGKGGSPGTGQEAVDKLLEQLDQIQQSLESGANPQDVAGQIQNAMQQLSEMMEGAKDGKSGQKQEAQGKEKNDKPGESGQLSEGESSKEQSHNQLKKGGETNERAIKDLFSKPNQELLNQLRQAEAKLESKFSTKDSGSGNLVIRDMSQLLSKELEKKTSQFAQAEARQLNSLEDIKRQQQTKMEAMYREMSGLDGEALRVYIDYMESNRDFIDDLKDFFINKFKLDKEYLRERNQRRGARLQRGFTQNILGSKDGRTVISPNSFERKRPPEKPQLAWTLVIDNSGSCSGEIIEQEKKLAVALVEVAKELDIPLEIVTFGGPNQFTFLKGFEQDISGDDLQKMVLLKANEGTPDVVTLDAACASMEKFTDKFRRSYNFVYFMTDGQSGSGSIEGVIKKHKKNMVMTGIGLAGAAQSIAKTWGKNALEVPDVKKLSDGFIRKIENQIDSTFD